MSEQTLKTRVPRLLALAALAVSLVSAALFLMGAGAADLHEGPLWLVFFCALWPFVLDPLSCLAVAIMLLLDRRQSIVRRSTTLAIAVFALILPWLPEIIALKLWLPPERAIRDSSVAVRRRAAKSLRERSDPEVIAPLIGALRDADGEVRLNAAIGLWNHGPETTTAVPALLDALSDPVYGVRAWAMSELPRIPGTATLAVPRLARATTNQEDRSAALDALFWFGPEAAPAVPALRAALSYPEPFLRRRAARALGAVGAAARPAVPELRALLQDEQEAVRETARSALVELGERDDLPSSVVDAWPKRTFSPRAWQSTPYWIDSRSTPERQRYVFYRDLTEKRLLDGKTAADIISLLGPPHVNDRYCLLYELKTTLGGDPGATWWLEIPLDRERRARATFLHAE